MPNKTDCLIEEIHHNNGERTIIASIKSETGKYAIVAFDIDQRFNEVMKAEGIGTAMEQDGAKSGMDWWKENNPKGLSYSITEKLSNLFS